MARTVPPCLKALLNRLTDCEGMFPSATLPCGAVINNHQKYRRSEHAWMLRWLVVAAIEPEHVSRDLDGSLAILSDPDEPRAAVIESKRIVQTERPIDCEAPPCDLDEVQQAGCFAKVRAGAVTREAIPSVQNLS
jgi:hypothetical protein